MGGGELQFERDADGLQRSSRRPADLSAGPPARGPRRGEAGLRRLQLLDRRRGTNTPSPIAEPSVLPSQFTQPVDGRLLVIKS